MRRRRPAQSRAAPRRERPPSFPASRDDATGPTGGDEYLRCEGIFVSAESPTIQRRNALGRSRARRSFAEHAARPVAMPQACVTFVFGRATAAPPLEADDAPFSSTVPGNASSKL